jgi:hypothetical protein
MIAIIPGQRRGRGRATFFFVETRGVENARALCRDTRLVSVAGILSKRGGTLPKGGSALE